MGIRIFHTKDDLQAIFESFEEESDEEDEDQEGNATAVVTSQLRHFVIQVYISVSAALRRRIFISSPGIYYDAFTTGPLGNHG